MICSYNYCITHCVIFYIFLPPPSQLVLRASSGIDYQEFYTFMTVIAQRRLEQLLPCLPQWFPEMSTHLTTTLDEATPMLNCSSKSGADAGGEGDHCGDNCNSDIVTNPEQEITECPPCHETHPGSNDGDINTAHIGEYPERSDPVSPHQTEPSVVSCPMSAASGSCQYYNHLVFDLLCVREVLRDMLQTEEFCQLDLTDTSLQPQTLAEQIDSVIQQVSIRLQQQSA